MDRNGNGQVTDMGSECSKKGVIFLPHNNIEMSFYKILEKLPNYPTIFPKVTKVQSEG